MDDFSSPGQHNVYGALAGGGRIFILFASGGHGRTDTHAHALACHSPGLPPSKANFILPRKKPLSSMGPTIIQQWSGGSGAGGSGGRHGGTPPALRLVVGGSGGPTIISGVLLALARVLLLGHDALSAVALARVHDQLTNVTFAEAWSTAGGGGGGGANFTLPAEAADDLRRRGHTVVPIAWGAVTQLIVADPAASGGSSGGGLALEAVSDPRKDGAPAGF